MAPTDFFRKLRVPFLIFLLLLIILTGAYFVWQKFYPSPGAPLEKILLQSATDITLTPQLKTQAGISPQTTFILASQTPLDQSTLMQNFQIIPRTEFDLQEKSAQEFEIIPAQALEKNTIYQFILNSLLGEEKSQELSWAFQIEAPLQITGSLPGNQSTDVPLNSALEIYFNNPSFINWENYF